MKSGFNYFQKSKDKIKESKLGRSATWGIKLVRVKWGFQEKLLGEINIPSN